MLSSSVLFLALFLQGMFLSAVDVKYNNIYFYLIGLTTLIIYVCGLEKNKKC